MRIMSVIISFFLFAHSSFATEEITPYKFSETEYQKRFPEYSIPKSSTFSIPREKKGTPAITYYFSKPKQQEKFPIALFCAGSSSKDSVSSVIHVHRYFLKEFFDLGAGLITLEQWGVKGNHTNVDEFMSHYTRTQRLMDHRTVINHLRKNPPPGWNGKFIFVGVSEGGPLVTALSSEYSDVTLATVNWSGAGDWNWREELWAFIEGMRDEILSSIPWHIKIRRKLPKWFPFSIDLNFPETREAYDRAMNETLKSPVPEKELMGMTYMYHADSLNWPLIEYQKIRSPYLVVTGAKDTLINSSDAFVEKAQQAGVNITYFRVSDMDHYVRKRQDILDKSFNWLKKIINSSY